MVGKRCVVFKCNNLSCRDDPDIKYFRFPVTNNKNAKLKDLSKRRQRRWLEVLKVKDLEKIKLRYARVCSEHFVSGKSADLRDNHNVDWIPSLNLGYEKKRHANYARAQRAAKREIEEELPVESTINFEGKSASLLDEKNPDWVPSLNLNNVKKQRRSLKRKRTEEAEQRIPADQIQTADGGDFKIIDPNVFKTKAPRHEIENDIAAQDIKSEQSVDTYDVEKETNHNKYVIENDCEYEKNLAAKTFEKKCIINGCTTNNKTKEIRLFSLPYGHSKNPDLLAIALERRNAWIDAVCPTLKLNELKFVRVCGKHFISGRCASLSDVTNPDWIPTLHLGSNDASNNIVNPILKRLAMQKRTEAKNRMERAITDDHAYAARLEPKTQPIEHIEVPCTAFQTEDEQTKRTLNIDELQQKLVHRNLQIILDGDRLRIDKLGSSVPRVIHTRNGTVQPATKLKALAIDSFDGSVTRMKPALTEISDMVDSSDETPIIQVASASSQTFMQGDFVASYEVYINKLKEKIKYLEDQLNKSLFTQESFARDNRKTTYFTGLTSYDVLDKLYQLVSTEFHTITAFKRFQYLAITLIKLRLDIPFTFLGYHSSMTTTSVHEVFHRMVNVLHKVLKEYHEPVNKASSLGISSATNDETSQAVLSVLSLDQLHLNTADINELQDLLVFLPDKLLQSDESAGLARNAVKEHADDSTVTNNSKSSNLERWKHDKLINKLKQKYTILNSLQNPKNKKEVNKLELNPEISETIRATCIALSRFNERFRTDIGEDKKKKIPRSKKTVKKQITKADAKKN